MFTVEIKRGYSKDTIAYLLDKPKKGKKQVYEQWFEQAERSRDQAGSISWLLITKRDKREPLIFVPQLTTGLLVDEGADFNCGVYISISDASRRLVSGMPLQYFLDAVKPEHIKTNLARRFANA
jgi:hypothetical protein